jgi:tetratricopeptide (TPR) repeat protein
MFSLFDKSKSAEEYCELGFQKLKAKKYREAISCFDKSIKLDPSNAKSFGRRGICWLWLKEMEKAIADFDKAIGLNPEYFEAVNNRAQFRFLDKDFEGAEADLLKAVQINPDFAEVYSNLGHIKTAQQDYELALTYYSKAIELDKTNSMFYSQRADCRQKSGDTQGAIVDFEQAISVNPDFFIAYEAIVFFHMINSDHGLAMNTLNKALEVFEKNSSRRSKLLSMRALVNFELRNYEKAFLDCMVAILLNPANTTSYSCLFPSANLLISRASSVNVYRIFCRIFVNEIEEQQKILKTDPNNYEAHFMLGALYCERKNFTEGRKHLDQAKLLINRLNKINPDQENMLKDISKLLNDISEVLYLRTSGS